MGVADVVADYRWIPHRLNADERTITFVRLEREDHRAVTFLEDKYFTDHFPFETFQIADVSRLASTLQTSQPINYVFHSSMAISTLVSRMFDLPGISMALKEPIILNQIAALSRRGANVRPLLDVVRRLLARPFGVGEAVVIKPGNVANTLIRDLMAVGPQDRALILYSPLPTFMRSIAKKGMWGRMMYRRLYALLAQDGWMDAGFSPEETFEQTDLQIAAMVWLQHQAQFATLPSLLGNRMRATDSESFLSDKRAAIAALGVFFGIALDADIVADSEVFSQHSKELGRSFDAAERRREYDALDAAYGEELDMVSEWAFRVADHCHVPLDIAPALVASAGLQQGRSAV